MPEAKAGTKPYSKKILMRKEENLNNAVLCIDILVLAIVSSACYLFFKHFSPISLAHESWLSVTTTCVLSYLLSSIVSPIQASKRMVNKSTIIMRVTKTCLFFLIFNTLIATYSRPSVTYPRTLFIVISALFFIVLLAERFFIKYSVEKVRSQKRNQRLIAFIGFNESIRQIYNLSLRPVNGYSAIAAFLDEPCPEQGINALRVGTIDDSYDWILSNHHVHEIYCYMPTENKDDVNLLNKLCDNHLIRFYYVPTLNVFNNNILFTSFDNIPVIARCKEPLSDPVNKAIKRTFDIVVSLLFLCTVYPFMYLIVGTIIKLKSPGPVYFKQKRTGLNGKEFMCIKFRSMNLNSDSDKVQATKHDPRIFPFGKFIRKTNIDEFPQFINVLKGEMSIVGPRPHMTKHTEEYSRIINRFMLRHFVKPGITGLAQTTGFRGETKYVSQMEGRVRKDIEYIENWTFLLDIKIIYKTLANMIHGEKNAY